jgi:hypothetical protein
MSRDSVDELHGCKKQIKNFNDECGKLFSYKEHCKFNSDCKLQVRLEFLISSYEYGKVLVSLPKNQKFVFANFNFLDHFIP